MKYSMLIQWSNEDQTYVVSLPEWGPTAHTHGDTYEEAARNGQEMLLLLVETQQELGMLLPAPQNFDSTVRA